MRTLTVMVKVEPEGFRDGIRTLDHVRSQEVIHFADCVVAAEDNTVLKRRQTLENEQPYDGIVYWPSLRTEGTVSPRFLELLQQKSRRPAMSEDRRVAVLAKERLRLQTQLDQLTNGQGVQAYTAALLLRKVLSELEQRSALGVHQVEVLIEPAGFMEGTEKLDDVWSQDLVKIAGKVSVARTGNVIKFGATGDAFTGRLFWPSLRTEGKVDKGFVVKCAQLAHNMLEERRDLLKSFLPEGAWGPKPASMSCPSCGAPVNRTWVDNEEVFGCTHCTWPKESAFKDVVGYKEFAMEQQA